MYSVISVKMDSLPANTKNRESKGMIGVRFLHLWAFPAQGHTSLSKEPYISRKTALDLISCKKSPIFTAKEPCISCPWPYISWEKKKSLLSRTLNTHELNTRIDCALHTRALHTATHCVMMQHTAAHCNTLQHTATHCNTLLPHTATHCNTV